MHCMARTTPDAAELLRGLPQVERLLQTPSAARLLESHPRPEVVRALRETLDELRDQIRGLEGSSDNGAALEMLRERLGGEALLASTARRLERRGRPHHRRVINATGIILHTGLGRAVLPDDAIDALMDVLRGYSVVEVDVETGERNRREGFVAGLLCELTGAEAATVVNNNAAATLIILAAMARGRDVIISRGQLVEIGGSYRIPDVMAESGARLVEVGTTNRTYIDDYRRAVGPETAMLLQVHTSNYEIAGFACHTPLEQLVALGQEHGLTVVSDLGSGCFVDLTPYGFRREPLVSDSVAAGAHLVCFSGDKLLGGPQAGIIVGSRDHVEAIRRHSLFRAMRVDKMTLAALEATLRLYRDPERLAERLPSLRMITADPGEVRKRAARFVDKVGGSDRVRGELVESASQTGSGSMPTQDLESWAAAIDVESMPAHALAAALRANEPPIFARIQSDRVVLDFRTLLDGDEAVVLDALRRITEEAPARRGKRS